MQNQPDPSSTARVTMKSVRLIVAVALLTFAASGANAGITLPNAPLQAGTAVPANIMFVLDDSGSMADTNLPDNVPATSPTNIATQAFTRNTIYYNPYVTYKTWRRADGSFMPDADYDSVATSATDLSGSGNLASADRTYYVPVSISSDRADARQYIRYRLRTGGTTADACAWNTLTSTFSLCTAAVTFTWGTTIRTLAQEQTNFANWYQYHRTRTKVAKAGASNAFNEIGKDIRVGFSTIHNRSTFNIPVGTDNGVFDDIAGNTNRSTWFNRLFNATANDNTPLKAAMNRMGQYYSDSSASGPWGPEATASQISCRQSFTILTTDGYANESAFATSNYDGTSSPEITGPNGRSFTYTAQRPYSDNTTGTLADIAMRYWKTDLRTDLVNNVPTSPPNPAFWQHMVTFGISIGAQGNLDPATDLPAITAGTKNWPATTPANLTPATIDDFWHATVNGRGDFVVASDPDEFSRSLKNALASILQRTRSNANVAVTSTRIGGGTRVFEPSYETGQWSGEIRAYPVTATGIGITPVWTASSGIPNHLTRKVFTWNGTAGRTFTWLNLLLAQQASLGSINVVNYLRGDDSLEMRNGGTYRDRTSKLGDVVNSSPVYDADTQTLYFGANDGMLHAVDTATGAERFAYVPSGVDFAALSTLKDPDYAHKFFVDGEVAVSTPTQTTSARRILVGTLGRGGGAGRRSVYALDVTAPATFDQTKVLWEFQDADLINPIGRPIIAKLNDGRTGVIIGNGYNAATDRSMLFILDIETGALISKVDTGAGSAAAPNGMATPKGWDSNRDGRVDLVYAGDLLGNVWRIDLTGAPSTWDNASNRLRLFVARDAANKPQPITGGMSVGLHPTTYKRWIFFGTGRYLTSVDPANRDVQSWYGLIDDSALIANRSDLKSRRITTQTTAGGRTVRSFEKAVAGDMAGKKGWYVDLLTPPNPPGTAEGERMVSDSILFGGILLASSIIPTTAICDSDVRGFVNAIDPFNGTALSSPFFDANGDGVVNGADTINTPQGPLPVGSTDLGGGFTTNPVVIETILVAGGIVKSVNVANPSYAGRVSWRELIRN